MEWLNLPTKVLHASEYIGSDPSARAAWLNVMLWCAQQENGGRIAGAATWKDRQWQQTCGVTLREVRASAPLLVWDGDDVTVWAYPIEKEAVVRMKREIGRCGGVLSGEARRHRMDTPNGEPNAQAYASPNAEPNGSTEGKGKEEEGKGKGIGKEEGVGAAPSLEGLADDSSPVVLTFPCVGKEAAWNLHESFVTRLGEFYPTIDVLSECRLALAKIQGGAVSRKTARGMSKFLFSWMDRSSNRRPGNTNGDGGRRMSFA